MSAALRSVFALLTSARAPLPDSPDTEFRRPFRPARRSFRSAPQTQLAAPRARGSQSASTSGRGGDAGLVGGLAGSPRRTIGLGQNGCSAPRLSVEQLNFSGCRTYWVVEFSQRRPPAPHRPAARPPRRAPAAAPCARGLPRSVRSGVMPRASTSDPYLGQGQYTFISRGKT